MKEKKIKVLKVEPKKKPEACLLKNELRSLQKAVSIGADEVGFIEIISIDTGVCLLCNEEGKLIGLEPNRRISNDIICGVFYIVGEDENGVLKSLSEEKLEYYANYFKDYEEISPEEVEDSIAVKFSIIEGLF